MYLNYTKKISVCQVFLEKKQKKYCIYSIFLISLFKSFVLFSLFWMHITSCFSVNTSCYIWISISISYIFHKSNSFFYRISDSFSSAWIIFIYI